MAKIYFLLIALIVCLAACAPSQQAIQTAIARTQTAIKTSTRRPTVTPQATHTLIPTLTFIPTHIPIITPRKTPTPNVGTLDNPFPFGMLATLSRSSGGEKIIFILQIKTVMRGQDAWSAIYSANRFNDAPPAGMEAIMIELYAKNISTSGILKFEKYDFSIVSRGRFIDAFDYSPCCLKNAGFLEFEILLAPNGEASGWIASMVSEGDQSPILAAGSDQSGRGGIYFSLASP